MDDFESMPEDYAPPHLRKEEKKEERAPAMTFAPMPKEYAPPPVVHEGKPGIAEDVAKGTASGLATGVVSTPGIIGSLGQLYDLGAEKATYGAVKLAEKAGLLPQGKTAEQFIEAGKKLGEEVAPRSEAEKRGEVTSILGVPVITGRGVVETAKRAGMPSYEAKTIPGKFGQTAGEFAGASLAGPGTLGQRMTTGALSGLTSEAAGQATKGTDYETAARLIGALPGALAGTAGAAAMEARSAPAVQARAEKIAGQVAREAFAEPEKAATRLEGEVAARELAPTDRYIPGVEPTTAQVLGGGEAKGLENIFERAGQKESDTELALRKAQEALSEQSTSAAAARAPQRVAGEIPSVDMEAAVGLPTGFNPQGEAARHVKSVVEALEEEKDRAVKNAWDNPSLKGAALERNKVINTIDSYLDELSPSRMQMIPKNVIDVMDQIRGMETGNIPLSHVQDLRSQVLSAGREAGRKGDNFGQFVNNELGAKLAEIINNEDNVIFDFRNIGQRSAWNNARAATADYHSTFGPKFVSDLVSDLQGGGAKIAGEATFDRMFSGPNAVQNLRQIRDLPGVNVDEAASNWLIGKLTKNGTNINVTPKDVTKFLSDPKTAALVNEVPGLRERISNIAQRAGESAEAARMRQLTENFQSIANRNNPKALAQFMDQHSHELSRIAGNNTNLQAYLDALHRSAKVVSKLPAGKVAGTKTLDKLANNNIMSIIYGRATGAISDVAAAAVLGHIAENVSAAASGAPFGAAAARVLGVGSKLTAPVVSSFNTFLYGTTQDAAMQLLQQAMRDPALMAKLLRKPSPEAFSSLSGAIEGTANSLGRTIPKIAYPAFLEQTAFSKDRTKRATGGRTGAAMTAEKLIKMAENAKKQIQSETKSLLEEPDENVVSALKVANNHI